MKLLGSGVQCTHRGGLLLARHAREAVAATRGAEKVAGRSALCASDNLSPRLVTALFSKIIEEAVRDHR